MTHIQIMNKFDRMRLTYRGTSEPHRSGLRVHRGYWIIPGENYEFRLVAIQPRNNWAIEIKRSIGDPAFSVYMLKAELAIEFIQQIICDKFELLPSLLPIRTWQERSDRLQKYVNKRLIFLTTNNLKRT